MAVDQARAACHPVLGLAKGMRILSFTSTSDKEKSFLFCWQEFINSVCFSVCIFMVWCELSYSKSHVFITSNYLHWIWMNRNLVHNGTRIEKIK